MVFSASLPIENRARLTHLLTGLNGPVPSPDHPVPGLDESDPSPNGSDPGPDGSVPDPNASDRGLNEALPGPDGPLSSADEPLPNATRPDLKRDPPLKARPICCNCANPTSPTNGQSSGNGPPCAPATYGPLNTISNSLRWNVGRDSSAMKFCGKGKSEGSLPQR